MTPPLFHSNFRGVPVVPDSPCYMGYIWYNGNTPKMGSTRAEALSYSAVFEVFQVPTYVITVPEPYGRTDRQTDILWHNRALRSIMR